MRVLALDDALHDKIGAAFGFCPLFRALKPEHFPQVIKVGEAVQFDPGEVIVEQGEPSDSFFLIIAGETVVRLKSGAGESVEIGRRPAPSSVGEVGLLLQSPRTASVAAVETVLAVKYSEKAFAAMFQKIPDFGLGVSAGLASRLAQVSGKMPPPDYDVRKGFPGADVLKLLPMELMQRHRILPIEATGNVLTLGLLDDPTSQAMSAAREHLPGMELRTVRIDIGFFNEVMGSRAGVPALSGPKQAQTVEALAPPASPRLDALLDRVVAEGASDLHLSAGYPPHWRIDGDIRVISDLATLGADEVLELIEPIMDARHREQFTADNDTDFAYAVRGGVRFRVNLFRDRMGVGAAMRLIPSKILNLDQLGMPPVLKTLCEIPKGLILVTGPTGCGKSTTLAAMIDHIKASKRIHIVTIEDPIEFVHESGKSLINQREVGGHTTGFARALRAALREDPDVVLVGEMRDLETISLSLEMANTGHLVLATLHTNSAVSTIDRIVDMFPAERQPQIRNTLADVLRGVVAQTLCKRIGGGRIAALEILVVNYAVSNLIRESKTIQIPGVMQAGRAAGMTLLNDDLARLVDARKIEMDEALGRAVEKEDLLRRYRSGLTLMADPSGQPLRVLAVKPASPAADAGLQRGDVLAEINGRPAQEHTLDEARVIFRGDGRHQLTIERGGKRLRVVMEIRRI
ncbi:MAG: PilT/PilU family type 4a pilus ATPase [Vicinamibacteria bacterium]|nr:PilT/PilU family type 4a pilus ATPase [Vicinamibacteria bacterium]